jgi:aspartyl-tRNA(Asn)/glutamyl-tRNA(Gln) amidotransferase subunit C
MADNLPLAEIDRLARLARLALTAEERDLFSRQLADILAYVQQVQAVDTTGVAPTSHRLGTGAARADTVAPSLNRDTVLSGAPGADREEGFFTVPRVLGS